LPGNGLPAVGTGPDDESVAVRIELDVRDPLFGRVRRTHQDGAAEEVTGRVEAAHPDAVRIAARARARADHDGGAVRTDGHPLWSELAAERERGPAGRPVAVVQARQMRARRIGEPVPHHDETAVGK